MLVLTREPVFGVFVYFGVMGKSGDVAQLLHDCSTVPGALTVESIYIDSTIQGDVHILNSGSMKVHNVVQKAHLGLVTTLWFSSDSGALASASLDSSARVTLVKESSKNVDSKMSITWECGLGVESDIQLDMLKRLRFKYATKILLKELNLHAREDVGIG
ncbi:sec12-like protein 2 [Tanacetum coccineum]